LSQILVKSLTEEKKTRHYGANCGFWKIISKRLRTIRVLTVFPKPILGKMSVRR